MNNKTLSIINHLLAIAAGVIIVCVVYLLVSCQAPKFTPDKPSRLAPPAEGFDKLFTQQLEDGSWIYIRRKVVKED